MLYEPNSHHNESLVIHDSLYIPNRKNYGLKNPSRIVRDIEILCHSIINNCRLDKLSDVLVKIDLLMEKMDQIGQIPTNDAKSDLDEMIYVSQLIQRANELALSKGLSMLFMEP